MKSLTAKFIFFIILPVIFVLSALSLTSYLMARSLLIDQMENSGHNFLRASAEQISSRIIQVQSTLKLLAITENLETLDDAKRQKLFVALKDLLGGAVTSVFMGFADGKFIRAKTTLLPKDFDPRKRPWYIDAIQQPPGILDGITPPYLDASTQHPTITIYHKVLDNIGALVGILGVDVDVAMASSNLITSFPSLEKGQHILVNADAVVLLHPDLTKIGLDIGATGEELDIQLSEDIKNPNLKHKQYLGRRMNDAWYMGFYRTKYARIALVLMVPAKTVLKPLHRLTFQIATINLSAIFGLFFLLMVVSRKISRPIIDLKNSAVQVTEEGPYRDAIEVKSSDEVGQLTAAFNEMMEGLRQRDFIRDTFGRYVTKEVVKELLDTSDGLKLGGEIREVTIMLSDLRGFTPISEQLRPEQVIEVLNSYLSQMSTIIGQYKGTINEFIGDAILTFFGAPVKYGDSPARAVACALAMQLGMEDVNRKNKETGLPPLYMGIGINTGDVIVGNIGSKERAKYGVVGHNINLASRVEGATIGGQILITPSTYEKIKDVVIVRTVRSIRFKGVEEDINLYDVIGMKAPYNLMLPDETGEGTPLKTSISVTLTQMKDKRATSAAMAAELTHFSNLWATLRGAEEVPHFQEIRVDFMGEETDKKIYMYAKVANVTREEDLYVHSVQISYLTPMVTQFIKRLSGSGT
ncbi:MAG: adenylate/guanylate cyclase domain-containing protein [Deltaproteobacteria bacterium]|jgi:class 3 adenylate cyclase|nr:adenylate/guanylate cyclase domain-containing protein [Deltaproteobacteria bacterium]